MDAHMHFDLYDDRSEILRYVKQKASYTIAMTNLPQLFEKYKLQYVGNKYFQLALGFHPELVHQYSNQQVLFKELINETRFIGEIGLDYTKKSKEDVMCQTEIFERIIEWCSGKNKILSVHSRSASKKVIDILNGFDIPVIYNAKISEIGGAERVEWAAVMIDEKDEELIECDSLILSVGYYPEIDLIRILNVDIKTINTVEDGFFACGTVKHGVEGVFSSGEDGYIIGHLASQYIKKYLY